MDRIGQEPLMRASIQTAAFLGGKRVVGRISSVEGI
jgi:hypothetical protein